MEEPKPKPRQSKQSFAHFITSFRFVRKANRFSLRQPSHSRSASSSFIIRYSELGECVETGGEKKTESKIEVLMSESLSSLVRFGHRIGCEREFGGKSNRRRTRRLASACVAKPSQSGGEADIMFNHHRNIFGSTRRQTDFQFRTKLNSLPEH